ncbi:hypothetical protein [Flavobacterium sp. CLA17]|uniref:hypothetical protein n=1 Tax=Flavobacterium sp. CLA17 TaxID=2724135 RepID=UPI001492423F|nr:hypothetical protein [Flavobacterium sp. CLA17]QSB26177.1 hypothetical protein HAV12_017570 [Flavobacterium sp. CLA17]
MDKKSIILFLCFFSLFSCIDKSKNTSLCLELVDKEVNTLIVDNKLEIVTANYKIKNNSDTIYLIKKSVSFEADSKRSIISNKLYFRVFDSNNKELNYKIKPLLINDSLHKFLLDKENFENKILKKWNNQKFKDIENDIIIIHPNETLYFQEIINLNEPSAFFPIRNYYTELGKNKKYYLKMEIKSDSSDLYQSLPKYIQETIKENNVKVYNGIIESKNKVPIKVLE